MANGPCNTQKRRQGDGRPTRSSVRMNLLNQRREYLIGPIDMSDAPSESAIVRAVAQEAALRITRKVVAALQRIRHTLSGDDSELKTIWDEICVQVQYEESLFWDTYDKTARDIVGAYLAKLQNYEREAIWLQTDVGRDWDCDEPENREAYTIGDDDIVDYLVRKYLYAEARRWSNTRIRAFIDRSSIRD